MCTLCSATRPFDPYVTADSHADGAAAAAYGMEGTVSYAASSMDQIAYQLTDGFWNYNGGSWRAFDVSPGGTLTYDVSGLTAGGQFLAVAALQAWTDVTGIRFAAVSTSSITQVYESGDAAAGTGTTASMQVNQNFNGTISTSGDEDWVRVNLVAGTTYTINLTGDTLADPYLELRDAWGNLITWDDDSGDGLDSQITYTIDYTGTYYLTASAYSSGTGSYDLTLTSSSSSADITFDDSDSGAYSSSVLSGNQILSSFVNVQTAWDSDPMSINSYWFQTYVHEIGHALGLGHAGNYNGNATWGWDNDYDNDSWQASIMSYFSQTDNPNIDADYAYLATVMPADIIAIQNLYGTNVSTRAGNTTYGANTNVGGYLGTFMRQAMGQATAQDRYFIDNPAALTIFDTGGIDTLDFSPVTVAQQIRLGQLAISNVAGLRGNLVIARGTVIENAIGGSGNDLLQGNSAHNTLTGGAGHDRLEGGAGNDTLVGGGGNDSLYGGSGRDTALFTGSAAALVNLGLTTAQNTGHGTDLLIGIENVTGGSGNDRLTGNAQANKLTGGAGNDRLVGGGGNDTLTGGGGNDTLAGDSGSDTAIYAGTVAVQVNLGTTTAQNTGHGTDVLTGIENIIAGSGNDRLTGNALANRLEGGAGHDSLYGGGGNDTLIGGAGNDLLAGGSGIDTVIYLGAAATIKLNTTNAQATGHGSDRLISIENVITGNLNDRVVGNDAANRIVTNAGADRLYGGGGADTLHGGGGNDTLSGGAGADDFHFNAGRDVITDFTDNQDEIYFARSLWGGGSLSAAQILGYATVQAGSVVFDFGAHALTVLDFTDINALADDILQY